jgi:hypothetical protein
MPAKIGIRAKGSIATKINMKLFIKVLVNVSAMRKFN